MSLFYNIKVNETEDLIEFLLGSEYEKSSHNRMDKHGKWLSLNPHPNKSETKKITLTNTKLFVSPEFTFNDLFQRTEQVAPK